MAIDQREVFRSYLRHLKGEMSGRAFAQQTGIPQPNLVDVLNGRRPATVEQVQRAIDALNIAASAAFSEMALIARDMERNPPPPPPVTRPS